MKMVDVKTAELIGPALDWMVLIAIQTVPFTKETECAFFEAAKAYDFSIVPAFSTDWAQGGPLIEKFIKDGAHIKISDGYRGGFYFHDDDGIWGGSKEGFSEYGETLLIAACRAIVAAHSGDVVSVPAELINGGGL